MIKKIFKLLLLLFFFNLISYSFVKADNSKVDEISKNLRCLICQGQSVYDSNSDFALSVKTLISQKLDAGNSEDDIYNFLKSKYGDWIVFKPQFNIQNSLLWILPYIALIFGGFFIFSFLKKRQ